MDLDYSPDELAFRDEVRAWLRDNLPADLRDKVVALRPLDPRRPAALAPHPRRARAGSRRPGRRSGAAPAGTSCSATSSRRSAATPARRRSFPSASRCAARCCSSSAPTRRSSASCRASTAATISGARAIPSRARAPTWRRCARRRCARGDHYVVNGQKTWTTLAHMADWIFCLVRTERAMRAQAGGHLVPADRHEDARASPCAR